MNTKRRVKCSVCGKEVSARTPKGGDGSEDYPAMHKSILQRSGIKYEICTGYYQPAIALPEPPKEIEYHLAPVWHDAKTYPPKEDGEYLCYRTSKVIPQGRVAWFTVLDGWSDGFQPTHWMPLPEPPAEED